VEGGIGVLSGASFADDVDDVRLKVKFCLLTNQRACDYISGFNAVVSDV
jgi:hypothetical protein